MADQEISNRMVTKGSSRDPERARRRILDAALTEFAARGFAGARVDRIARGAGLNKRMLYHYFGDKRGLHAAVLERAWRAGGARIDGAGARLLLWALLEPDTAEDAVALLARLGSPAAAAARDGAGLTAALLDGLLPQRGGVRGHKPRVRLKPAPA